MRTVLALTFVAVLVVGPPAFAHEPADTVGLNGKIYTVNEKQPWAEAIAIKGADIVYVGDSEGANPFIGTKTTVATMKPEYSVPPMVQVLSCKRR